MEIHQIFEIISVAGILIGLLMLYIVAKYKTSENQKNLVLICCATLVIDLGNFFILYSDEYEALLHGHQLITIGLIFVLTAFILFMAGYCQININQRIKNAWLILNFLSIGLCLTCNAHNLFFKKTEFINDMDNPHLEVTPGVFFLLFRIVNIVFILIISAKVITIAAKKTKEEARKYYFIIASCISAIVGDVITEFDIIKGFSFAAVGVTVSIVIIGISIWKYGILDVMQVAKDNLLENVPEGLVVVDTDKELTYFNKKAKELLPFLALNDEEYTREQLKKIFDGQMSMVQTENGYYEIMVSELMENGALKGYMAWLFDLSFINQYTKEIVSLKEYADRANRSKTVFLANMSHEIRTPMNAIVGFNELIYQKTDDEEIREYASDIKTASANLLGIINDILDLSKIESGKMELKCKNYFMKNLIDESVINIISKAKDKGLEFIQDIDTSLPYELYGDIDHLRNILINLLNNAVKYTREGFVKLTVGLESKTNDEASIRFSVADSGIGIAEEDLNKIFNKFEKLDLKRNSDIEGTGLGLAIVKGYVELMGGTIHVDSQRDKGSTFSVVLTQKVVNYTQPLETENKVSDEVSKKKKFKAPNARILVTDDNAINLKVTASLLKAYGIRVDTAESGRAAIGMCRTNPYDIIFIDHMMPEMDGVEAMKRIRTLVDDESYRSIIIALTANAISGVKEMLEAEGFDGYISKPIDTAVMESVLLKFLPQELICYDDSGAGDLQAVAGDVEAVVSSSETAGSSRKAATVKKDFEECLEGFNVEQGITNCGGEKEDYIEVLRIYLDSGESRIEDFERFLESKDYKNYIIAVHGLKSSSASIGAMEFSERAKSHEFAGKEERFDYIHADFEEFVAQYRQVLARVREVLICEGIIVNKSPATESYHMPEELQTEVMAAVAAMARSCDMDGVKRLLSEIEDCHMSKENREFLDKLWEKLESGDTKEAFCMLDTKA